MSVISSSEEEREGLTSSIPEAINHDTHKGHFPNSIVTHSLEESSIRSGTTTGNSSPSLHPGTSSKAETDSIGSATSILYGPRSSPLSRPSTSSIARYSFDADDEILVGDERELHESCKTGHVEVVERLVKSGVDVNCRNKHDRTPMLWASGNGHLEIVQVLLDEGAAIDLTDKFGMDALLWAAWFGHKSCFEHLLRVGFNVNARNKHGFTWLHCAAQNNHKEIVEVLTEEMQDFDRNAVDDSGKTSLHIACTYGRTNLVKRLLDLGCDACLKDKSGNTALHIAAKHGFHEVVPFLVKVCKIDEVNADKKTALHVAAEEGKAKVCEELLGHNADVNVETEDEMCPLHFAVRDGQAEAAHVLIDHDADIDAGNKHNQTPLHFAVMISNLELTNLLINAGANTSVADARNETVLHIAAENGQADITQSLLLANASTTMVDHKGKTPLDVASRGNYITIVDMIIKAERYRHYVKLSENNELPFQNMNNLTFKPDTQPSTQHFRMLLFRLATKYLKTIEWKQLAFYWGFTDKQLSAIEEQFTGSKSYREHGHRMLLIWLHGCSYKSEHNPVKGLYEGLLGIQKAELAETMRLKASEMPENKNCSIS
uniref:Ankyrin repeat and death domain-containing protein 1A-like n=1 Tax=Phallusia mammillata TaxID=59560 RepID=A0A6F9D6X4_9ASCI|nr:ankyrin repeat and death domain-containing protein 1A-like [Phallusia mammillata]